MIILDTNVLSALMRHDTEPAVLAWLDRQVPEDLWTTAVTIFEIRLGIEILAGGRRRRSLEQAFTEALHTRLSGRILAVDRGAAEAAATIAAELHGLGSPIEVRDLLIAGITSARKASLATCNPRHFERTGVMVENPWHD